MKKKNTLYIKISKIYLIHISIYLRVSFQPLVQSKSRISVVIGVTQKPTKKGRDQRLLG